MKKFFLIVLLFISVGIKAQYFTYSDSCKGITRLIDKFTNDTMYFTESCEFMSFIKDSSGIILIIEMASATPIYKEKGVYVLFKSGYRIMKQDVDVSCKLDQRANYIYRGFFRLSKEEINHFINDEVTDLKLYNEIRTVKNVSELKRYLNCLAFIK